MISRTFMVSLWFCFIFYASGCILMQFSSEPTEQAVKNYWYIRSSIYFTGLAVIYNVKELIK